MQLRKRKDNRQHWSVASAGATLVPLLKLHSSKQYCSHLLYAIMEQASEDFARSHSHLCISSA
jgi:hypothetical protein